MRLNGVVCNISSVVLPMRSFSKGRRVNAVVRRQDVLCTLESLWKLSIARLSSISLVDLKQLSIK